MKRNLYFALILGSAAVFLLSIVYIVMPSIVINLFPFLAGLNQIIIYAAMGLSIVLITVFGSAYATAKEKELFNEFGVRKKNAKRKLSSYRREQVEALQLAETERLVSQTELKKATHRGSENPEEDLEKMIGLYQVKEKVLALKARMDFDLKSKNFTSANEMHHMVFYGPPGTGKTTVARIITGLLYDYGYIDENKTVEVDGNFLKGGNPADTEKKVRIILSRAKGGVLFVDEAYALTQSRDASGKQAIATLIKEMEDGKGDFVAIFAGYPNEMSAMLDANPGFRSRIKDYISFPDYDDNDLKSIAILMAKEKGFSIDPESFSVLLDRLSKERKEKSWGNARTVRNVIEESIDNHAYNFSKGYLTKAERYILCPCDINRNPQKHI